MAAISKEEYLKRYLSNADSGEKKKRKKKIKTGVKTGKCFIIDDDVNLSDIRVKNDSVSQENLLELADENPLIFDEAGATVLSKDLESIKKKEEEKKAMWAPVRNIEDEIPLENIDQSQVIARYLSPTESKIRKARHDSPSPQRGSINDKQQSRIDRIKVDMAKQQRHDSDDVSPQRHSRHDSSSDQSPIRQTKELLPKHAQHGPPDLSPQRRNTNTRQGSPTDQSPIRRTRHDSLSDQSPPRMQQISRKMVTKNSRNDSANGVPSRSRSPIDQSPPRRNRHDASNQLPPRNRGPLEIVPKRNRHDSPDLSPPWKMGSNRLASSRSRRPCEKILERTRHDSPDLSLPQRNVNRSDSADQSPPRRQRTIDNKNRALNRRHDTLDVSPPRKTTNTRVSPSDLSPPRKQSEQGGKSFKSGQDDGDSPDQSSQRKQKNLGLERKSGLHSAAELRQENKRTRQRENEMFARMSSNTTGKGAETIHRDKAGRKRDFKVEEAKKREEERKKQEENEKFMEWGKGVQQSKRAKDKVHDDLYEMSKPLARYKDDTDLDQMLKDRDRAGDPMLAFVQKKKVKQDRLAGKKEKPRYKGPAPPPNRFNIPPGYRWDGVDRSNGFEKKRFSMLSNKGATREEAYKWSTEDM